MRWILAAGLVVVWGILLLTSHALQGFVHLLLIAAGVILMVQVIQGHRGPPGTLKTMTLKESELNTQAKKNP
jgi:hypothetical protein